MTDEWIDEKPPATDRMAKVRAAKAAKKKVTPDTPDTPDTVALPVDAFKAAILGAIAAATTDEQRALLFAQLQAPTPVALKGAQGSLERSRPSMPPGRVKITLEENDNIPPTGQFFGINGASFMLRPGVEVSVPAGIVDILDNAIMSVPVKDPNTLQVIGYRNKRRYPYQVSRVDSAD